MTDLQKRIYAMIDALDTCCRYRNMPAIVCEIAEHDPEAYALLYDTVSAWEVDTEFVIAILTGVVALPVAVQIPILIKALTNPRSDAEIMDTAAYRVVRAGNPALPALIEILQGTPERYSYLHQRTAAWIIGKIGIQDEYVARALCDALFRTLSTHDAATDSFPNDPEEKAYDIAEVLHDYGDHPLLEPILLSEGLTHPHPYVRDVVTIILKVNSRTVGALLDSLLDDGIDQEGREDFLLPKIAYFGRELVPYLSAFIQSGDHTKRFYALSIWIRLKDAPPLADFITDDVIKSLVECTVENKIRPNLLYSSYYGLYPILQSIGNRVVGPLLDLLHHHPNPIIRHHALWSLYTRVARQDLLYSLNLLVKGAVTLNAQSSIRINAPAAKVWEALTTPSLIKQWFFGVDTETDWKVGSSIVHRGEWQGKRYVDKGEILRFEPPNVLAHSHWSDLSGLPDREEYYQRVTYEITDLGGAAELTIHEVNIPNKEAQAISEKSWATVLNNLKQLLEKGNER